MVPWGSTASQSTSATPQTSQRTCSNSSGCWHAAQCGMTSRPAVAAAYIGASGPSVCGASESSTSQSATGGGLPVEDEHGVVIHPPAEPGDQRGPGSGHLAIAARAAQLHDPLGQRRHALQVEPGE